MLPFRAMPFTSKVPAPEIVRAGLEPKAVRLPARRMPAVTLVPPEYVLLPERVASAVAPLTLREPLPLIWPL